MRTTFFALSLGLAATACSVFDGGEHLESLRDSGVIMTTDSGPLDPDAGPVIMFDDECGAPDPLFTLARTQTNLRIDTRAMGNHISSTCGGAPTLGADAFIAVEVQAGEYWHFHLRNDPSDPASTSRTPALYLLFATGGSCDARDCRYASDVCSGSGDEHFAFVANAPGTWYLGIDDRATGGSRYLLDAIHPTCGENGPEHGEGCDDGNRDDGDGCSQGCLDEITEALPNEVEPNDNPNEANLLLLPASGEMTVRGNIGGEGGCRYADTYGVRVPAGGAHVEVDVLKSDGTVCDIATLSADYELALRNAAFVDVVPPMVDANGCAYVRSGTLAEGLYYVTVLLPTEITRLATYSLRVRVVP